MRGMATDRLLLWSIDETAGFDSAWVALSQDRLTASGRVAALRPTPYWLTYHLEADDGFATRRMAVEARWQDGAANLDLQRADRGWTVNGEERVDLGDALDCDLAACPLTNTMPILRHGLHRHAGQHDFVMAFIEVPSLRVVPSGQRYTHLRAAPEGGAVVRYASGSFSSDLVIDADGFVVEYPQLGRRLEPRPVPEGIRGRGPGSVRPA